MPMDFPDMKSLINAADIWKFRKPNKNEPEIKYRNALADHVHPKDLVESEEIRNGIGWDKFSSNQNARMLGRTILHKMSAKDIKWHLKMIPKYDMVPGDESGRGYGAMVNSNSGRYVELKDIQSEITALIQEFKDLYSGSLDDEAVSLLLTKLQEL